MTNIVGESLDDLCEACHLLYARGMICSSGGNVSLKIGDSVFITRTGATLGKVTHDDLVEICLADGKVVRGGIPSKELGFHLGMLRSHPEYKAVVHVHPTMTMAFSALYPTPSIDAVPATNAGFYVRAGKIPLLPYFPSGSKDLHDTVNQISKFYSTILLGNHGIVVARKTLLEATNTVEEIEQNCQIFLLTGEKAHFLSPNQRENIDRALGRTWPEPRLYQSLMEKLQEHFLSESPNQ
jgi:3-dehydro-4-phosphotetronate decarboxylase